MSRKDKPVAFRTRLISWYVGLLFVVLLAFSWVVYALLEKSLYASADAALQSAAVNAALLHKERIGPGLFEVAGQEDMLERLLGLRIINKYTRVVDISGQRAPDWLGRQRDELPLTQLALENAAQGKLTYETFRNLGPHPVRILTMPVISRGQITGNIVQVGASLESVESALHKLALTLLLLLPGALVVASLGGWFLATRALKPVDQITRTVRDIHAQNLKARLTEVPSDDEIGRLVETFNEMLERLDASFNQIRSFTADASHELKTPLTILKGEIELALRRPRTVEEYQEVLVSSLEEIERLTHITSDLLLLAKSDSGTIEMEKEPVNLSALIEEAAQHVQPLAEEKHLILQVLPGQSDVEIRGDRFRLKQLILNLVENAIHYTPAGGKVVVRADRGNAFYAVLEVSDTGIGIAPEDQERIFERFYRTDKARNRREGGTGLGLAIVKWIVESHGGKIEVHSKPKQGSTFTVYLPFVPDTVAASLPTAPTTTENDSLLH